MRRLALNLLTSSLTVLLLGVLTVPAKSILGPFQPGPAEATGQAPKRAFGVYVDPWHVDDWAASVGAEPQMVAKFEAFSLDRTIEDFIAETERRGIRRLLVSWEPWKPVPASLGSARQSLPQRGYRNRDIAGGSQDEYIRRFAENLATFDGIVYLRYAHEMNGTWYPWSHDRRAYVRAWRHVVDLFREAGARNVRYVWSVNPSLYLASRTWLRGLQAYWPGRRYVDTVGSTMINFGGEKDYTVRRFVPRLRTLHRLYRMPIMITEANTQYEGRVLWLRHFREMLQGMPWIESVAWSQLPSRGKAQMKDAGNLDWDVQHDPPAAAVLRRIIDDGLK